MAHCGCLSASLPQARGVHLDHVQAEQAHNNKHNKHVSFGQGSLIQHFLWRPNTISLVSSSSYVQSESLHQFHCTYVFKMGLRGSAGCIQRSQQMIDHIPSLSSELEAPPNKQFDVILTVSWLHLRLLLKYLYWDISSPQPLSPGFPKQFVEGVTEPTFYFFWQYSLCVDLKLVFSWFAFWGGICFHVCALPLIPHFLLRKASLSSRKYILLDMMEMCIALWHESKKNFS